MQKSEGVSLVYLMLISTDVLIICKSDSLYKCNLVTEWAQWRTAR